MSDNGEIDALPPEASRALWSEIVGHIGAVALTIPATLLAHRVSPEYAGFGLLGTMTALFLVSWTGCRWISRTLIFTLPPDTTHWTLHSGLSRWAPRKYTDALPAWQVYAGRFYGPGVGRALGFGFSLIFCTLAVAALTGPMHRWLTILLLLLGSFMVIVNALSYNRLPPRDGTFSLF